MAHNALANPIPAGAKRARRSITVPRNAAEAGVARFLRSFQALLVATRLYQKNHPLALSALEGAELHLRAALEHVSPISIGVENGAMVYAPAKGTDPVPLESDEPLGTVAEEWRRRGLRSLIFLPSTNLSELDSLARLWHAAVNWTGPRAADEWSTQFAAMRIAGIRANVPLRQRTGTILATLVSVLVAHGGDAESAGSARNVGGSANAGDAASPANFEDLTAALRILARLEPIASRATQTTPQQTAEIIHTALMDAERRTLSQLIRAMSQAAPRETESVERYLARLSESLLIETLTAQFLARRLAATEVRDIFKNLADAVAQALRSLGDSEESIHVENGAPTALVHAARALVPNMEKDDSGGAEIYVESLHERFWDELPARDKAALLRGADAWCVPVTVIGRHIERLLDAGRSSHGNAPVRESRIVIANYARALEAEQPRTRRAAAGGLAEMLPVIAKLWRDTSPVELDRYRLCAR